VTTRLKWLAPFILLALALLVLPEPSFAAPTTRHFILDAVQFEFLPGRLEVNQGDRVVIALTAADLTHGFYLDGYGLSERVEPGLTKTIDFVAGQAGKFRYRCSVTCGPLHPFMIGDLVVGPNTPFWRAVGLLVVSLAGLLVYLWKAPARGDGQPCSVS
jgi:heme/copper-type cytochrome/quinol oxidase subunit 2